MQLHTGRSTCISPLLLYCHCRDLKPENILVTLDGDIKVVDFGVSQDFGNESNAASGFVRDTKGSWPFWAPEMIDNHSANAYSAYSADVWAAGVCLWIFVFGALPFWAPGPSHLPDPIFEEILSCKISPPTFPSRRSPELCDLLLAIFTVSPQDRPTFQDLSRFDWIQQHTQDEIEMRLNAISSVPVDCSDIHLDAKTAVTPGEVNFLSENAKTHFVKMAQRIREKVKERHQQLLVAKDEEIETKREEMKHYDPIPTSSPASDLATAPTTLELKPLEPKLESDGQTHPSNGTPKTETVGVGIGREFSKQSNWTSQTGLVESTGPAPASHDQREGMETTHPTVLEQNSTTTTENKKNCSCCNVQ